MRWARRISIIALFAGALYVCLRFPARNAGPVRVDYLFFVIEELPLWLAVLEAFAAGLLVAGLVALYPISKAKLVTRRYRKAARRLESEIHELRNLPLAPERGGNGAAEAALEDEGAPLERGV